MGMFDRIRNFFSGDKSTPVVQQDDRVKKERLGRQIVSMVDEISRTNSFDSSIWNLTNMSTYDLQRRSLAQLEQLHSELSGKLERLQQPEYRKREEQARARREELEGAKWSGQKPEGMSDRDFDRFQRDER